MPMYRKSLLVLLMLVALGIGGTLYGYYTSNDVMPLDAAEQPARAREEAPEITVYVTGAVNRPGLVSVPAEARAADAVNACGGLLPTADAEQVNLAQPLKDGQQIRVPERALAAAPPQGAANAGNAAKAAATPAAAAPGKAAAGGMVNINTADEATLDTLPGVGPAMAKRIIEYRSAEGAFRSIEDIKKVRGIGEAKFEKMKDRITI